MKKWIALLLAAAMLLSLGACGSSTAETDDSETTDTQQGAETTGDKVIKIAVAAPMTGDNAEYGIGFANAAELMATRWNEDGGVNVGGEAYTVEIVSYDDKSESDEATTIAYNIVSDPDIYGVIGHFASGICMVAAPIYQEAHYINISPSSSHADYSSIGDYIFRNNTVINSEAMTGAQIALEDLGGTKVGVLSIDTEWGQSAGDAMEENIATLGGTVALRQEVSESAVDFATEIANFKSAGADVIMVASMYGTLGPLIVAMQNSDYLVPVVGCTNAYTDQMLEYAAQAPDVPVYAPASFFAGNDDPAIQEYVAAYEAAYGTAPSGLTTHAYDSVGILLEAIERAGSLDREAIKDAMYETDYPGMSGQTTFDEVGDAVKVYTKITIQDGEWTLYEP